MQVIFPILTNVFKKTTLSNILEILVMLILVTLPLGGYAINSISVIAFFTASTINFIKNRPRLNFTSIHYSFFSIYALFFLSLIWTENVLNTLDGLVRFLSYLVLPTAFLFTTNQVFNKEKIFSVFSFSLVFYAIYCILLGSLKALIFKDTSFLYYHQLSGNLSNLNAIYLSVFTSFAIGYFLFTKINSRLNTIGLLILSLFLILLSSKIIIFTTVFGILFFYFIKRNIKKKNHKYLLIIVGFLVIFISSSNFLKERIQVEFEKTKIQEVLSKNDFGDVYLWTGTGLRIFQIKAFVEILAEQKKIFFGLGLNNSQKYLNEKYQEYNLYAGFQNYNFHNQYLQLIAELGLAGFLLFFWLFYLVLREAILKKEYFFMSFIFLTMIVCITETFLWRQRGMVFFIVILFIFNKKNYAN